MSQISNKIELLHEALEHSSNHILLDDDNPHINIFVDITTGTQYAIDLNENTLAVLYFNSLEINISEEDVDKYLNLFNTKTVNVAENTIASEVKSGSKVKFNI